MKSSVATRANTSVTTHFHDASPARPRSIQRSTAAFALLLFVLVNGICWPIFRAQPDSNGMVAAFSAFAGRDRAPSVVFLGSSVAKHVIGAISPNELESRQIANLAFNMQLVSDGFILTNELLKGSLRPNLIVLCVTPRDFSDPDVPDLIRTTTFRRAVTIAHLPFYASVFGLNLGDELRATYNYLCCFYDGRAGVQEHVRSLTRNVYNRFNPIAASPNSARRSSWSHSLEEYAWRYTAISNDKIASQMSYLRRGLDLADQHGIEVVLVNLPLSKDNLKLLPSGFYETYCHQLSEEARMKNVDFIDLSSSTEFTDADFYDCAHLNKPGAEKVLSKLRPFFAALPGRQQ